MRTHEFAGRYLRRITQNKGSEIYGDCIVANKIEISHYDTGVEFVILLGMARSWGTKERENMMVSAPLGFKRRAWESCGLPNSGGGPFLMTWDAFYVCSVGQYKMWGSKITVVDCEECRE